MQRRADQRSYHYIYKITRNDGKYYIGMHSTDDLEDGYFGSGQRLSRSIKKHGKDIHSKEILEFLPCRETLKAREKELVNYECLADAFCMNLRVGGEGGGSFTFEQRSAGGKKGGKKIGKINVKFIQTPEAREKANITKKKNGNNGWLGKTHKEETKIKVGLANSEHQKGNKNSQFGTCWINDGTRAIKIKKIELNEYLEKGFSLGRKMT
jgi:hypothetical protein